MCVQPLICDAQRARHGRRVVGNHGRAVRARDREALATLAQRIRDPVQLGFGVGQQHAELVAAHPVRDPERRRRLRELGREAGEQGVAGRMAERVVVRLETVEVEDRQGPAFAVPGTLELVL